MMGAIVEHFQLWSARHNGKRDGKKEIPHANEKDQHPFALLEIKDKAGERLSDVAKRYAESDRSPKGEYLAIQERLVHLRTQQEEARTKWQESEMGRQKEEEAHEREIEQLAKHRLEEMKSTLLESAGSSKANPPATSPGGDAVNRAQDSLVPNPAASTLQGGSFTPAISAEIGRSRSANATLQAERLTSPPHGNGSPLDEKLADAPRRTVKTAEISPPAHDHTGIRPVFYWTLIALVVFGEIPLNAVAFRVFGESNALTYVMTLSVALILILAAHGLGALLAKPRPRPTDVVLQWVLILVPMVAMVAIGIVRTKYLQGKGEGDIALRYLGPLLSTLTFTLINVLIFAGTTMLSYFKHDPRSPYNIDLSAKQEAKRRKKDIHRTVEEREKMVKEEARVLGKEQRERIKLAERENAARAEHLKKEQEAEDSRARRASEIATRRAESVRRTFDERRQIEEIRYKERQQKRREEQETERRRLAACDGEVQGAQREEKALKATREALAKSVNAEAIRVKRYYERLMAAYCTANIRARKDRTTPPVLRSLPEIDFPEGLREAGVGWDPAGT